jgi:hypothetical protein
MITIIIVSKKEIPAKIGTHMLIVSFVLRIMLERRRQQSVIEAATVAVHRKARTNAQLIEYEEYIRWLVYVSEFPRKRIYV